MASPQVDSVFRQLERLERKMKAESESRQTLLEAIPEPNRVSANNLIHYLTLRNEDIRDLQDELHILGLSSLASSESHILSQIQSIQERLGKVYGPAERSICNYEYSLARIEQENQTLFGRKLEEGIPYIMVTFDSSFAENYAIIKTLLQNGMNVARINCARDNEAVWSQMIQLIRRACQHTGLECKIYMDLAGPKIRTQLIGRGNDKGKVKIEEGEMIWLAETPPPGLEEEVVVSPNEQGILSHLEIGERVFFDDGIIKGIVEKKLPDKVGVRISRVSSAKKMLKEDKGINFPDSELPIVPLSGFDVSCLPFICSQADMIGYSFVRYASDLKELQIRLQNLTPHPPKIIIKIETPQAVKNLPSLILQGLQSGSCGVMIARGDLAVEIGFERMGEIQEEILWISESAHVPVIWATQVLESLNKSGIATRSEITDASHAALAECVMVNKGDHTIEVIETLRDILVRAGGHHSKKRYIFRPLRIAQRFMNH